jgi:hypothetical protein
MRDRLDLDVESAQKIEHADQARLIGDDAAQERRAVTDRYDVEPFELVDDHVAHPASDQDVERFSDHGPLLTRTILVPSSVCITPTG